MEKAFDKNAEYLPELPQLLSPRAVYARVYLYVFLIELFPTLDNREA